MFEADERCVWIRGGTEKVGELLGHKNRHLHLVELRGVRHRFTVDVCNFDNILDPVAGGMNRDGFDGKTVKCKGVAYCEEEERRIFRYDHQICAGVCLW